MCGAPYVPMAPVTKNRPVLGPHYLGAWRKKAGLTQEAAAHALDMDRGNLSKIENGKVPYSQGLIEAAAALYGVTPADIIGTDPDLAGYGSIDSLLLRRRADGDVWQHILEGAKRMTRPTADELAAQNAKETEARAAIQRTLDRAHGQKRPATTSDD